MPEPGEGILPSTLLAAAGCGAAPALAAGLAASVGFGASAGGFAPALCAPVAAAAGVDLPDRAVDARLEAGRLLEGADLDRGQEVPVLAGPGAALHVAELGAVGGAGEHRREDAHDHRHAGALEAAARQQQPVDRGGRVDRRAAVAIGRPPL